MSTSLGRLMQAPRAVHDWPALCNSLYLLRAKSNRNKCPCWSPATNQLPWLPNATLVNWSCRPCVVRPDFVLLTSRYSLKVTKIICWCWWVYLQYLTLLLMKDSPILYGWGRSSCPNAPRLLAMEVYQHVGHITARDEQWWESLFTVKLRAGVKVRLRSKVIRP